MQLQISCLEKAKAQDAAMALVEVDTTVKRFYKLALCFICILSWDMLEGAQWQTTTMQSVSEHYVCKKADDSSLLMVAYKFFWLSVDCAK